MPLNSIATLTVERQRGTSAEDSHGNDVLDWTTPDRLTIEGCWIDRPTGGEYTAGRQTSILELWLWMPPDADVTERDRIKVPVIGTTYEVDSPIFPTLRPRPGQEPELDHKSCRLKAITG